MKKTREQDRRKCRMLLVTACRVGIQANERKTECLIVAADKQGEANLSVGNLKFKNVTFKLEWQAISTICRKYSKGT